MLQESGDSTLHLPRILCLHGGGTNARIFRAQCRSLVNQLKDEFRLVFAEAPLESEAGPDVARVYGQWGPFKSWLRWNPAQPWVEAHRLVQAIDAACHQAMARDSLLCGATGEWVGLLGFSQGAKVAASLLHRQQLRAGDGRPLPLPEDLLLSDGSSSLSSSDAWSAFGGDGDTHMHGGSSSVYPSSTDSSASTSRNSSIALDGGIGGPVRFRFGVLLAGRGPLVSLDPDDCQTALPDASQLTTSSSADPWDGGLQQQQHRHLHHHHLHCGACQPPLLSIPTVHLHGLRDPGLKLHRRLFDDFCHPHARQLLEWDGEHRVPLMKKDVLPLVEGIRSLAKRTGVRPGLAATLSY